ncbi:GGDEF domain-containing protein [Nitrosomonas sp. Nm166]|uniref:GGDEF domain-containing protein n=1 Tax=Nitrosomonas sp. Nm166 TaxID=1881054 RepID=UPI0008DFBDB3|nr:GGDEF domain-containing protein [Nitrosomonas sp. Nm166]SFD90755.1 diguanylate cyclase [Nitrosomonas sp. Nm166]
MSQDRNLTPLMLARETLQQLSLLKIPPTPENYHRVYNQIAGKSENTISESTAKVLEELISVFPRHTPNLSKYASALEQALEAKNWYNYKAVFINFIETEFTPENKLIAPGNIVPEAIAPWGSLIEALLKQLENNHGTLTIAKKRVALNHVLKKFSQDPKQLYIKLETLIDSWRKSSESSRIQIDHLEEISSFTDQNNQSVQNWYVDKAESGKYHATIRFINQLLELQVYVLEKFADSQMDNIVLAEEAKALTQQLKKIQDEQGIKQWISNFKEFCLKFDLLGENDVKLQQGLLRLLNLLINNANYLLSEDQWLKSKILMLKEEIAQPLSLRNIAQAEHYLEEIIQRQKIIKRRLDEAKLMTKQMVASLISNIEELYNSTGKYHARLGYYSEKINQIDDIEVLNQFLVEIMEETKQMQKSALNYRNDFLTARAEVYMAQNKISQLETELLEMGEKVHEDHLTGILNRRGFDNAFERESSHAARHQTPLSFALLDIDNFKQLNDTHGHKVGDDALVYLVKSVKETTRPEDIMSRYGGEEFIILLPNTKLEEAVHILSRIRRNLTRKFFMHENKRLLITFSAGVAQLRPGEAQVSIFKRADNALYRAKKGGKNQILTAE